jgi:hypothetical protein
VVDSNDKIPGELVTKLTSLIEFALMLRVYDNTKLIVPHTRVLKLLKNGSK